LPALKTEPPAVTPEEPEEMVPSSDQHITRHPGLFPRCLVDSETRMYVFRNLNRVEFPGANSSEFGLTE